MVSKTNDSNNGLTSVRRNTMVISTVLTVKMRKRRIVFSHLFERGPVI